MLSSTLDEILDPSGRVRDTSVRAHHLKSLELQGYKTFASRNLFEFGQKVTAIVGPNGSGKSNIADAIRWVLGEQSYTLLRGKKTEDMIFAGSESRPRASMASATITFDNSDGWLPIEFAEVSISRRAYRDGENEYLLNGHKVRLREVAELLAEVGLAQRTYTVIGQGLVDAALSLKAEERRRLFEEAAGIGLYRSRREESLRRLEATRHNLERVHDIVAELRPRLRSLEKQAERARNYEQVKTDLESALRTWYGHHWHRMLRVVAEARREAEERSGARERLRLSLEASETDLGATRARIDALRSRLHQLSQGATGKYGERETLGTRLAVAQERLRWLQQRELELNERVSLGDEERKGVLDRLEAARQDLQARQQSLASAEALHRAVAGGEGDPAGHLRAVEARLAEAGRELEALVAREAAGAARLAQLQARRQALESRRAQAGVAYDDAQAGLAQRQAEAERIRATSQQTSDLAGQAAAAEAAARQAWANAEERRLAFEKSLGDARVRVARQQALLESLTAQSRASDEAAERLQQAARTGRVTGWLGSLEGQLRIAPEVETAVFAALGDFAGGLALATPDDVLAALEWVESEQPGGDWALTPTKGLRSDPLLTSPDVPGCMGNAADHVRAPEALMPVVQLLLGRTLIANDRAAARRLLPLLPADARVVTRAGEIFFPAGHVQTVRSRRAFAHGERRRQDVEAEAGRVAGEVERLEAQGRAASEDSGRARETVEQAARSLLTLREAEREATRQAEAAERAQQESRQRTEFLRQRLAEVEQDLAEVEGESAGLTAERAVSQDERLRLESEARIAGEAARAAGQGDVAAQARQAQARLEAAEQAVMDARGYESELLERLAAASEEIDSRRSRLASLAHERSGLMLEAAQAEQALQAVDARLAEIVALTQPAEQELGEAEIERARLEAAERRARTEAQEEERRHSQSQIEHARRQEELNSLKRRIEDDFGLVAFDFDENTTVQTPLPFEGLVERLPEVEALPLEVESQVERLRIQLRRMGAINPEAQREYFEVRERVEFMTSQIEDLRQAESKLQEVIAELDELMEQEFQKTFDAVAAGFRETFTRLFGGGVARLHLTDPNDLTNTGIDIEARLPGRREQGLSMLSGGERSLTACALVFSLLKVSPTPLCVLDEVDAMLDEANVARFREMLQELSAETQFIIITHNRETVQAAQVVYGISMGADSASTVISLKLEEAARAVAEG